MRRTASLATKDLAVLWTSPLPYVGAGVFHVLLGLLYVGQLEVRQQALIQPMYPLAGFLMILVVPMVTMRCLSDEIRSGTLDTLLAAKVPAVVVVTGKWLAAWLTVLVVLAPTSLFVVLLHLYGSPEPGPIVAGYFGLVLLAAVLTGLGVLTSGLTSSAPVAGAASLFSALALWFIRVGPDSIVVSSAVARFSLSERLRSFAGGGIDSGDLVFFLVATAALLALTGVALRARRLR